MAKDKQTIMLVDDNLACLTMCKNIFKSKYEVYPISSGAKLFEILAKVTPDLILLDVLMPEMDGYEVIKRLKSSPKTQDIPVIFLTARDDPKNENEGLSLGAVDYISKPFSPSMLLKRIDNHLQLLSYRKDLEKISSGVKETPSDQNKQNYSLMSASLGVLAEATEFHHEWPGAKFTNGRNNRIKAFVEILLNELDARKIYQLSMWDRDFLMPACALHDIGKMFISESIMKKPERLTDDEFTEVKKHCELGVNLIDQFSPENSGHVFIGYAKTMACSHHEKWDGTGYPNGLKEDAIPLPGRIMALADGYDALTSIRPYRKALDPDQAGKIIMEGKGTWLDPVLTEIFSDKNSQFAEIAGKKS